MNHLENKPNNKVSAELSTILTIVSKWLSVFASVYMHFVAEIYDNQ